MGAERFKETLAQGAMGPPMQITLEEASRAVQLYRNKNAMIVNLWDFMKKAIGFMITGHEFSYKCLAFRREEVVLPNGLSLWYPHLGYHNYECMYASGHGKRSRLYDGLLTENVVQALARIVVAEQMRTISKEYRIVTTTHDEVVYLAEEENADKALQRGIQVFRTPPSWCADLPLNAEGAHDECYSK